MNILQLTFQWLTDPDHWSGPQGIPAQTLAHLGYTALAFVVAAAIAVPIGMYIGHTGKAAFVVINIGNAGRALPTIGLIALVVLATSRSALPVALCLALLAIPPIMTATYTGIRNVDPDVVDAARGIGMTEREVVLDVELPNALPVMMGGARSAALQLISTATVAAFVGLGGLGRYILDGPPQQDYGQMAGGALLVALLAILVDLALAGVAKLLTPTGLQRTKLSRSASKVGSTS